MTENIRNKGKDFAAFMKTLSSEEIARGNKINAQNSKAEYQRFVKEFNRGYCYLCEKPLATFCNKTPCPHWLLKPNGFKKKHLSELAKKYGFFQVQSFLRWVANQDGFARNINDLSIESTGTKLFEVTIKHKNLEWAFSCAESDYMGHALSRHSQHPHYHFQMRIDGLPFINYSDFHLPLSEMDIINIESMRTEPNLIKHKFRFGEGMNEIFTEQTAEHIVSSSISGNNADEAPFHLETLVFADKGTSINGDDLCEILKEAKEKGVTVASLIHKIPNTQTTVIVTPGPGVVEQAPRNGNK